MPYKICLALAAIAVMGAAAWLQPTVSRAEPPAARDLPALVVLVRHAEKAPQPKDDPPLTVAGKERAQHLAAVLRGTKLSAIITTQYLRMRDTVQPTANALKLTPEILPVKDVYDSAEIDAHVKAVVGTLGKYAGGSVLVLGHGNMIPEIIAALGGPRLPRICDPVYDHLFVIASTSDKVQVVSARYGTASPPARARLHVRSELSAGKVRFGSCMDGARGAREKNLTFSRNDTGAVMYPASKCSRSDCGP